MRKTHTSTADSRQGFSFPEVLMTVLILSILAVAGTSLISNVFKMWRLTQARTEAQRDSRTVINLMSQFLKQASAQTVVVDRFKSSEPFYSRISFSTVTNDQYKFYQDQQTVKMQHTPSGGGTSTTLLASNLRYMAFSYPQSVKQNLVNAALCFEVKTYGGAAKNFYMTLQKFEIDNP